MEEHEEEIEVIDVSLNEKEIDEMIAQLMELKEHKESVQIPIASDLDLSVNYDTDTETSEGDDGDDGDDGEDNPDGNDAPEEGSDKMEEIA